MNKSFERATRIVAVTAALLGGIGESALAETMSPRPSIAELARQIEAQKTLPGKTTNTAEFKRSLPKGEEAFVQVGSTKVKDGKPDPRSVDYLDISVMPSRQSLAKFVSPIVSVSFLKESDGKWSAYETFGSGIQPNTAYHTEEIDESYIQYYTNTVTGNSVATSGYSKVPNSQQAVGILHASEAGAAFDLKRILHDVYFVE